ncbi:MAG: DUF2219 family protein [Robiginitalea sp.]|nr:DUF2219 family protein [Robiginitalea sp.]
MGSLTYLLCAVASFSQEADAYKYALGFKSDNDAYVAFENFDRFYTFGANIFFAWKPPRFLGLEKPLPKKKDYFFQLGLQQEGYTPTKKLVTALEVEQDSISFDRPFAGLLYGTLEGTYILERSFLKTAIQLGLMGPSALSKEMQDWIHENITGDGTFDGWAYQVPDQLILNLNVSGAYDLLPQSKFLDVYAAGRARLGNLHIDATPVLGFRLGKFGMLGTSSAYGNTLVAPRTQKELFLRSTVSTTFTAYNGTAQGNIFRQDFEYAVQDLSRFHIEMTHGIYVSGKRYALGFDHIFSYNKVVKGTRHIYARVDFIYRF